MHRFSFRGRVEFAPLTIRETQMTAQAYNLSGVVPLTTLNRLKDTLYYSRVFPLEVKEKVRIFK